MDAGADAGGDDEVLTVYATGRGNKVECEITGQQATRLRLRLRLRLATCKKRVDADGIQKKVLQWVLTGRKTNRNWGRAKSSCCETELISTVPREVIAAVLGSRDHEI